MGNVFPDLCSIQHILLRCNIFTIPKLFFTKCPDREDFLIFAYFFIRIARSGNIFLQRLLCFYVEIYFVFIKISCTFLRYVFDFINFYIPPGGRGGKVLIGVPYSSNVRYVLYINKLRGVGGNF